MTSRLSMTISSTLTKEAAIDLCRTLLPEFIWKFGDSEYQGFYVSGRLPDGGSIKCWPGEEPMELGVSLLDSIPEPERLRIMELTKAELAPRLGTVLSVKER